MLMSGPHLPLDQHNSETVKLRVRQKYAKVTQQAVELPWAQIRRLKFAIRHWMSQTQGVVTAGGASWEAVGLEDTQVSLSMFLAAFETMCAEAGLTKIQSVEALRGFIDSIFQNEKLYARFQSSYPDRCREFEDLYAATGRWLEEQSNPTPKTSEDNDMANFTDIYGNQRRDPIATRVGLRTLEGKVLGGATDPRDLSNEPGPTNPIVVNYESVDGSTYTVCVSGVYVQPTGTRVPASPTTLALHMLMEMAKGGDCSGLVAGLREVGFQLHDATGKSVQLPAVAAALASAPGEAGGGEETMASVGIVFSPPAAGS